jgi:hypothetical protein
LFTTILTRRHCRPDPKVRPMPASSSGKQALGHKACHSL